MRPTTTIALTLVAAVTCPPPSARASDEVSISSDGQVLHRRLPNLKGARSSIPVFVYDPESSGGLPREFQRNGVPFPAPDADAKPTDSEASYDPNGLRREGAEAGAEAASAAPGGGAGSPERPGDRFDPRGTLGKEALPDRDTEMEGTLGYHASFDPSVVPFKRNRVLDQVTASGSLSIRPQPLETVELLGNQGASDREVFWGSVLLHGRTGDMIPLPSVAAGSRVLSIEARQISQQDTEERGSLTAPPRVGLTLHRDGADNLYVRPRFTDDDAHTVRLVFLMDAPRRYFGRVIPGGLTYADVPHALRPRLPESMQRSADIVAARLGLSRQHDYRKLLRKLVHHFRSFEPGQPPPDSGDVYRDLALGKRGICRHRAYAFVVTAHGLGIPARYVFNEAHVFVEVWVPGSGPDLAPEEGHRWGWLRVDLGGGAERLVVEGAEDKLRHIPTDSDPFDRPAPYARQTRAGPSAGASSVIGLPPTHRPSAARSEAKAPKRTGLLPPPVPLIAAPGAAPTVTTLTILAPIVYRGEPFEVDGAVTLQDGSSATGRVRLVLLDAASGEAIGLMQTVLLTPEGTYATTLTIPSALRPGGYEITAEFLGGPTAAPSRSP